MPALSSLSFAGYLGRNAELKYLDSGQAICEFSVAVTTKRQGEESTAWYRCSLWGKLGESMAEHLTKGTAIIGVGDLVPREYRNKQDELRTSLDVNVKSITFAGGGGGEARQGGSASPPASPSLPDDDIPF